MRHFPLAEVCRLQIVPWGTSSACSDGAPSRMRVHAATEPAVSHPVQSVQARSSGDGHVERVTAWSVSHTMPRPVVHFATPAVAAAVAAVRGARPLLLLLLLLLPLFLLSSAAPPWPSELSPCSSPLSEMRLLGLKYEIADERTIGLEVGGRPSASVRPVAGGQRRGSERRGGDRGNRRSLLKL